MNSTLDLLKLALNESDDAAFRSFMYVCTDSKLFQKERNLESIVTFTNSLLNVSSSFENGLEVLQVLLPQCKSDIVGKYLPQWLNACFKGLQNHEHIITVYSVLNELIISSKDYPDVKKQTSLNFISKIMEYFFQNKRKFSNQILIPFLTCLEGILKNYGKACGNWKSRIDLFLLSQLENSLEVVNACARCFLNLAAVMPAKGDLEVHKEQWLNKQKFLVSALHAQLDSLFYPINEIQGTYDSFIVEYDKKCIPEISEVSPLKKAQRTTALFINIAEFLNEFLLGEFPVGKKVLPAAILSVVCRGLAVNCTTLEANISNDTIILSSQIPSLHRACISLLESLIRCCRNNLLSKGKLLCKLLTQTLKWTKVDCEYGQDKPYSSLRVDAYNCFNVWLTISRKCSNVEDHMDVILPSLLADMHSEPPSITLAIPKKRLKGKLGKKERKKHQDLSSIESKAPVVINPEANKDTCEASLNFIPSLLEASSAVISPKVHKQLQTSVINELMMIQAADRVSLDLPIPYINEYCRLALYKSLLALCNNYHPEFPIPCNYALPMFTEGLRDESLLISRFCGQAVGNIQKILHPIVPTLNMPLVLSSEISSFSHAATSTDEEIHSNSVVQTEIIEKGDKIVNEEPKENDSVIIESISSLFETQPSESTDNNSQNEKLPTNTSTEPKNSEPVIPQEESVISVKMDGKYNKEVHKISEIVLAEKSNYEEKQEVSKETHHCLVETEKNKTQKRVNNDIIDYPQEKKKKDDITVKVCNKQDGNEVKELEVEMLSSFVDVVN